MANTATQLNGSPNEKSSIMKKTFMATIFFLILIDFIFLAFIGFWAVDASAQMGGWMSPGRNPGMMPSPQGMQGEGRRPERIAEEEHPLLGNLRELGLDEKQQQDIKIIQSKLLKEMIKKRTDEQLSEIEIKELLEKEPVDLKAVETLIKRKESLKSDLQISLIRGGEEIKSILTPDQRKRFKTMLKRGPKMRVRPEGRFDG